MWNDWYEADENTRGARHRARVRPEPPRYCPRCTKPRQSSSDLCPECGERLKQQVYCVVCEAFWPLPATEPCPKHEIPLEIDQPQPVYSVAPDEVIHWVTVETFLLPLQAEAARLRLEAEGIPTLIDGKRMAVHLSDALAAGGVRLQVPNALAQEARILLSQSWAATDVDDDDDEHIDWVDMAPVQEPMHDWQRPIVIWGVVLALLIVVGLISLTQY